jgi:phosphoribosylamine---glycine ligase
MKILVVGGGGREHALVWRLRESARVSKLWCAPGNGGIAADAECVAVDAGEVNGLVELANQMQPDLTIVGPEVPLVNGLTDAFRARGWAIVGPSQRAAQLEGSKIFSKEFLLRHGIPTAKMYGTFDRAADAVRALDHVQWPLVIKADGLCAGKGVCLAGDAAEARDFIERALLRNEFGAGGQRILLEETLEGDELSFILVTDGERYAPLVPTRDHKRVFDGDLGPNTGGMGAYSSDELLSSAMRGTILSSIVEPTLAGLSTDGIRYQGFLYVGLMLTADGPKVLEFNCRLGDPETQAIVARMDFDLAEVLADVAADKLDPTKLKWKPGASVCVVLTSGGYPGKYETGRVIQGLTGVENITGVNVLHAGTKLQGNTLLTAAGRVLGVTAVGPTLEAALRGAYDVAQKIHFEGVHYRKDIGAHRQLPLAAGR